MADHNTRVMREIHELHGLKKPSVTRLLVHIVSSAFSSGMLSLLILGSTIILFLRYYNVPSANYFALLFASVFVLAFLHGCRAWQQDLSDYQKSLADARHTYQPHK